jgi:PAS domain S-box-containing protein
MLETMKHRRDMRPQPAGTKFQLVELGETGDLKHFSKQMEDLLPLTRKPSHEDLKQRIRELEEESIKGKRMEEALRERVKELNCLYSIAAIIEKTDTTDEIFRKTADLMPSGWYYPGLACARITYGNQEFKTENFQETAWKISADMIVYGNPIGVVEVRYLQEMADRDEGPFLKEERDLINAIAERLGRVAERKGTEEALWESEALFRKLFEQHAAVKLIIDPADGSIIDANAQAVEFYGWTRKQLIQMKIQDINILSPEEIKQEMEKARARKCIHFEFRHRRADGSIRDVDVFSSKVEARGKELLHSIVHDITERKQLEGERVRLISELQQALSEIKKLSGMLPICASCKKIRNDEGYWEQIEWYIKQHSEAEFSHSICPDCAKMLYPELYEKK